MGDNVDDSSDHPLVEAITGILSDIDKLREYGLEVEMVDKDDQEIEYQPVPLESSGLQCFHCGRYVPTPEWCDGFQCPCGQLYEWRMAIDGFQLVEGESREPYPGHEAEWITEERCACDDCADDTRSHEIARREVTKTTEVGDGWQRGQGPEYTPGPAGAYELVKAKARIDGYERKLENGLPELTFNKEAAEDFEIGDLVTADEDDFTDGPDEVLGVVGGSEDGEPEPDSDVMGYLHSRYGVAPELADTTAEVQGHYTVTLPIVEIGLVLLSDGRWQHHVLSEDSRPAYSDEHETLEAACDAADNAVRQLLDETRELL
ncbi:MAG: hypothetical protein ABEN55_13350 [Bradymonadaceae bacterium]